jgi:hypothetical protein
MRKEIGLWIVVIVLLVSVCFGTRQETMAIRFTNVDNQKVAFGDIGANINPKTISFWIYINSSPDVEEWFSKGAKWFLYYSSFNKRLGFTQSFATSSGYWVTDTNSIVDSTNYHIVISYDNSSYLNNPVFYINGALVNSTEITTPSSEAVSSDSGISFSIGESSNTGVKSPDGRITGFRIYNRILTAAEVLTIYNSRGADNIRNGLVFCPFLKGAAGLQVFDGATLAAGNTIVDPCSGAVGVPAGSPVGVGETYLVR